MRALSVIYLLALSPPISYSCHSRMLQLPFPASSQGRHFNFFLGANIFFIFQCHRIIEKLEKTALYNYVVINLTLFIVPFFLSVFLFFSFFLFFLFFFLFFFFLFPWGGGDGPQPPSNDAPASSASSATLFFQSYGLYKYFLIGFGFPASPGVVVAAASVAPTAVAAAPAAPSATLYLMVLE